MKSRLVSSIITFCLSAIIFTALLPQPVHAAPSIVISPKSGAPGTKVTVAGNNFTSYNNDRLSVFFGDDEVASARVTAPLSGAFSVSFPVPRFARSGNINISVKNNAGVILAEDIFSVPASEVRLNTWGGTAQTPVFATARGFYSGKPVTFQYRFDGETETLGTRTASETGECSFQFNVPPSQRGKHSVIAVNEEGQSASVDFEIVPSIAIEPGTVAVGDKVNVVGTGYTGNNEVSVSLYDRTVAYAKTTERGSFNAQFIVPLMKAGNYPVQVEDLTGETKWGEVVITSRVAVNRSSGAVGAKFTMTGTGFEVRSLLVVKYDAEEVAWLLTDTVGSFNSTITVPVSSAGTHVITATDGSNTYQVIFTVESEPPAAPVPLTPIRNSQVTAPLSLNWESVYDLSQPLFYTMQIAREPDFLHPLIEKTGLRQAQYTLTDGEKLLPNRRGTYYYWRVRATDGASNVGEWSEPAGFRMKPVDILPPWARYALVALQVLIVIVYVFQLRKGLASKG
ncbi:MAG: IPT/TIG domain-containing protein [Dehalococcoidia bacterium]|nr:IPT/TIG domain-containing protein [Dehalococcoidia bacterium]